MPTKSPKRYWKPSRKTRSMFDNKSPTSATSLQSQQARTLLDPAAIQSAEALGLAARFIVEGYMAGEHASPLRGFSMEFNQHREYVPGDDIRHLDWKVLGRTDRYYLKQYEQDTNFIAHIVLDASESMKYGSGEQKLAGGVPKGTVTAKLTKFEYGKVMTACLAYLILHQRDATSMTLFDNQVRSAVPRTGNLGSIHNILSQLAAMEPTQSTSIGPVLHHLASGIKRRGIVILISDLFDDEKAIQDGIQHLRFGGNEVIVLHTMDPFELDFPFTGNVEFLGLENIPKTKARPKEIRKTYLREIRAMCDRMRIGCENNSSHYFLINTAHAVTECLSAYLRFRLKTHR